MTRRGRTVLLSAFAGLISFGGCFAETGAPATTESIRAEQDGFAELISARPVTFFLGGPEETAETATARDVAWAFGDGNTSTGNPVTHTILLPGPYTVTADADGGSWTMPILVEFEHGFTLTLAPGARDGFAVPVGPGAHTYTLSVIARGKDAPLGDVVVVLEDEDGGDFRQGTVGPGETLDWEGRVPAHRTGRWGIGFANEDPVQETHVAGVMLMTYTTPGPADG